MIPTPAHFNTFSFTMKTSLLWRLATEQIVMDSMVWKNGLGRRIVLREGDITRLAADAIVNAANSGLAGGGGVDGAIHRAGGPEIMRELDVIRSRIGRCPTGGAVVTGAGSLAAQFVFHAVGPVYRDGTHGEPELLASCYRKCLELAEGRGVRTIGFPAISTGVYGYPLEEAAEIAIREVASRLGRPETAIEEAIFVLFGKPAYEVYAAGSGAPRRSLTVAAPLPIPRRDRKGAIQVMGATKNGSSLALWWRLNRPDVGYCGR
jgi:O-acetyl-ADP-ribose deacetylase (regulator of RNase III)